MSAIRDCIALRICEHIYEWHISVSVLWKCNIINIYLISTSSDLKLSSFFSVLVQTPNYSLAIVDNQENILISGDQISCQTHFCSWISLQWQFLTWLWGRKRAIVLLTIEPWKIKEWVEAGLELVKRVGPCCLHCKAPFLPFQNGTCPVMSPAGVSRKSGTLKTLG